LAQLGHEVYQELYHNDDYVFTIYGMGAQYCDDGNSVILHLKAGDEIAMRAQTEQLLYGNNTTLYSSLTGVRLYTEEEMLEPGKLDCMNSSVL